MAGLTIKGDIYTLSNCTVYIDEAGDLGINKGTQWFVLSAVIVDKIDEPKIRAVMDKIKARLNIREIHLQKVNDFMKRAFIVRELNGENFTYMNILVDKFDRAKIPSPLTTYNYVCKYLLERVSMFLENSNRVADIVLSARGTSRDGELIQYIQEKLFPYPLNNINESVFEKVTAKTAPTWDMLQLADVCATTTFLAYEINGLGFCAPCFIYTLQEHLFRPFGKVDNYGIKFFARDMFPDLEELHMKRVCGKWAKKYIANHLNMTLCWLRNLRFIRRHSLMKIIAKIYDMTT